MLGNHSWDDRFGALFGHIDELFVHTLPASVGAHRLVSKAIQEHWPVQYVELLGLVSAFATAGHPKITIDYLSIWAYYHSLAQWAMPILAKAVPSRGTRRGSAPACWWRGRRAMFRMGETRACGQRACTAFATSLPCHLRRFRVGGLFVAEAMDWYWSGGPAALPV